MEPWNDFGDLVTVVCRECCTQFTKWVDDGIMEELARIDAEEASSG
jgi:hypothetical protein